MPSLWRDLFTVSRPSSRNRSRSRTISSTVNGVDSTDQEHFVLVKPYSRADDYTKASSRVRSYSNPPKPQPIHIRAPSQPEMIHVLPPANAASDAATHRKSVDSEFFTFTHNAQILNQTSSCRSGTAQRIARQLIPLKLRVFI